MTKNDVLAALVMCLMAVVVLRIPHSAPPQITVYYECEQEAGNDE